MMRTIWNGVAFIAVVNLLAVLGFGAWLGQTDRLSVERLRDVRRILAPTLAEAEAAQVAAQAESDAADVEAREAALRENPPLPAAERIMADDLSEDVAAQQIQLVRQEVRERQSELSLRVGQLESDRRDFEAERQAWLDSIAAEAERRSDEQFAKAVKLYGTLKPKDSKAMMVEIIAGGDRAQVVRYLDALPTRTAAKILAEFKTPEERGLASGLLEDLRRLDRPSPAPENAPEQPSDEQPPLDQPDG
ncbi:MAG: hypothetical protein AB8G96_13000 [Phycisphaerales bacterium]